MNILMLWKLYPEALDYFYKKNLDVIDKPFAVHYARFITWHLGWPTDLAHYINTTVTPCFFVAANDELLQKKWALEHSSLEIDTIHWEKQIATEQIKQLKPSTLWIASIFDYYGFFIKEIRPFVGKVICWIGSPFIHSVNLLGIDILLTENPLTLATQHHLFKKVIVTSPGFDVSILDQLNGIEKKYDLSFIGSLTPAHSERLKIINYLLKNNINLELFSRIEQNKSFKITTEISWLIKNLLKSPRSHWGSSITKLKNIYKKNHFYKTSENLIEYNQGAVFGLDMYKTLAASHATLNPHIDYASGNGNNMRMFEATGSGSCLITTSSKKMSFTPGQQVITYQNKEQLLEELQKLIPNKKKLATIATAGQQKTLLEHTLTDMYEDIAPILF